MHVFSGVLDEDFLVEFPTKSITELINFQTFTVDMSPDLPKISMLCMLEMLHTT